MASPLRAAHGHASPAGSRWLWRRGGLPVRNVARLSRTRSSRTRIVQHIAWGHRARVSAEAGDRGGPARIFRLFSGICNPFRTRTQMCTMRGVNNSITASTWVVLMTRGHARGSNAIEYDALATCDSAYNGHACSWACTVTCASSNGLM